jgi:uncharacterized membrane protein
MKIKIPENDEKLRDMLAVILRIGIISSAALVVFGGILFFIQHTGEIFDYTKFRGEPARLRQVHLIVKEAISLRSRSIIQLGLLLLIITPVARVFFSLFGFALEKDWTYLIITFIVLFILLSSLLSYFPFI